MLSKCDITHNNATENGGGAGIGDDVQGGIILRCKLSDQNFIAYNNASNNGGATNYGYAIYVGGSNNTIWNNTVRNNTADGIFLLATIHAVSRSCPCILWRLLKDSRFCANTNMVRHHLQN